MHIWSQTYACTLCKSWTVYISTMNTTLTLLSQVNHLSALLLTLELLPTLLDTAAAIGGDCRVVCVASRAHERGVWDPRNMDGEVSYSPRSFYENSKLYNVST